MYNIFAETRLLAPRNAQREKAVAALVKLRMSVHLVNFATQLTTVKLIVARTFVDLLCYLRRRAKVRRAQIHLIILALLDKDVLKSLNVIKTKFRTVVKPMVKHQNVIRTAQDVLEEVILNAPQESFVFR